MFFVLLSLFFSYLVMVFSIFSFLAFFLFSCFFHLLVLFFLSVVRADAKTEKKMSKSSYCKNDDSPL